MCGRFTLFDKTCFDFEGCCESGSYESQLRMKKVGTVEKTRTIA